VTDLLAPGVARLHVLRLELLNKGHFDSYRALANEEENARADRFQFEKHRQEFLATRGLVRTVLGGYASEDPKTLTFTKGQWGKPLLASPAHAKGLSFNLSNTDGMVVLLVARDREVGVDVEKIDRNTNLDDVAARVFAPAELAALRRLSRDDQRERFFAYWTLKEAYIKARGMGLALPLEKFCFDVERDAKPNIAFAPPIEDDPKVWQFGQVSLSSTHRAAWAVRRTELMDIPIEIVETVT
jgi:4'-phosphopantetheinyl transferase